MLDLETQTRVEGRIHDGGPVPRYADLCFSNIPSAVRYLLGAQMATPLSGILDKAGITPESTEKVVLFLLDGFGYRQWVRYMDAHAYLRRFTERGVVAPITSVFPSTTAAALTTICSGLTPQEHGLPEWLVYVEELDRAIFTIPFVYADAAGGSVSPEFASTLLYEGVTIYEQLAQYDIPSYTFNHVAHTGDPYSTVTKRGSTNVSYKNASDMLVNLRRAVSAVAGPAYFYVYWDLIDSISHTYGPHSDQYLAELNSFFHLMQTEFVDKLDARSASGLSVLMTADHGHVRIDPNETIFLNDVPLVMRNLRRGRDGQRILPWGSSRDCFLAIEPDRLEETYACLTQMLAGKAEVLRIDEALARGLFGQGAMHPRFRARLGDLLIIPHDGITIWFEHKPGERSHAKLGMHGGLSLDELLVPFACAHAGQLIG